MYTRLLWRAYERGSDDLATPTYPAEVDAAGKGVDVEEVID